MKEWYNLSFYIVWYCCRFFCRTAHTHTHTAYAILVDVVAFLIINQTIQLMYTIKMNGHTHTQPMTTRKYVPTSATENGNRPKIQRNYKRIVKKTQMKLILILVSMYKIICTGPVQPCFQISNTKVNLYCFVYVINLSWACGYVDGFLLVVVLFTALCSFLFPCIC